MNVRFKNRVLERCYREHRAAVKKWNEKVARRYVQRINLLFACSSVGDLSSFPQLRFHALKGDKKGYYALDLDNFWRLIVSVDETRQEVCVEAVSKHYDD